MSKIFNESYIKQKLQRLEKITNEKQNKLKKISGGKQIDISIREYEKYKRILFKDKENKNLEQQQQVVESGSIKQLVSPQRSFNNRAMVAGHIISTEQTLLQQSMNKNRNGIDQNLIIRQLQELGDGKLQNKKHRIQAFNSNIISPNKEDFNTQRTAPLFKSILSIRSPGYSDMLQDTGGNRYWCTSPDRDGVYVQNSEYNQSNVFINPSNRLENQFNQLDNQENERILNIHSYIEHQKQIGINSFKENDGFVNSINRKISYDDKLKQGSNAIMPLGCGLNKINQQISNSQMSFSCSNDASEFNREKLNSFKKTNLPFNYQNENQISFQNIEELEREFNYKYGVETRPKLNKQKTEDQIVKLREQMSIILNEKNKLQQELSHLQIQNQIIQQKDKNLKSDPAVGERKVLDVFIEGRKQNAINDKDLDFETQWKLIELREQKQNIGLDEVYQQNNEPFNNLCNLPIADIQSSPFKLDQETIDQLSDEIEELMRFQSNQNNSDNFNDQQFNQNIDDTPDFKNQNGSRANSNFNSNNFRKNQGQLFEIEQQHSLDLSR